jgi:hypothetical protein
MLIAGLLLSADRLTLSSSSVASAIFDRLIDADLL